MPSTNTSGMPAGSRMGGPSRPFMRRDMPPMMDDRRMPCGRSAPCTESVPDFPLAMAYVPWQHFHTTYELEKAFSVGTIFPELDKPFLGRRGCRM